MEAKAEVASVTEYLDVVLAIHRDWAVSSDVWYRGVRDTGLSLLPGAYWRPNCDEVTLFHTFKARVPTYVSRIPVDEWEWYYLMQHHCLPTRLLDWTESALAALYFACMGADARCYAFAQDETPGIWMLDPAHLNAVSSKVSDSFVAVPDAHKIDAWLPGMCRRGGPPTPLESDGDWLDNSKPVAIYPKRMNPRIVAQRGVFTVHGVDEVPIDRVLCASSADPRIAFVNIARNRVRQIVSDLSALGVDVAALFPEADSVARGLMREHGLLDVEAGSRTRS